MKIFIYALFGLIITFILGRVIIFMRPQREELQKFLIVQPVFGYANRMGALAAAHVIAVITNRTLILNWQLEEGHMPAAFAELFHRPIISTIDDDLKKSLDAAEPFLQKYSPLSENENRDSLLTESSQFVYLVESTPTILPKIQWFHYSDLFLNFLRSLQPNLEIASRINEFYSNKFVGKTVVGVHYRSWETDQNMTDFQVPLSLFFENLDVILKQKPETIFFLATDSITIRDAFLMKFGNKIIFYEALAVDRNSKASLRDSVVEWFLLSKTNYILGTCGSSFSDLATTLTKDQRKIQIGEYPYSKIPSHNFLQIFLNQQEEKNANRQ